MCAVTESRVVKDNGRMVQGFAAVSQMSTKLAIFGALPLQPSIHNMPAAQNPNELPDNRPLRHTLPLNR